KQTLPHIKPLLGWYDESNPEVIDWQIKWAVEHGISTFYVDWYWNQGVRRLDHWVKAFYKAKYRSYLKWCLMWANHNPPGAHSTEDTIRVTKFWIDNYFKTPEYYCVDGCPVVQIWTWFNIDRDFIEEARQKGEILQKGEGVKRALDLIRKQVRAAGFKGVYFVAMNPPHRFLDLVKKVGFNETGTYGYQGGSIFSRLSKEEKESVLKKYGTKDHTPYHYAVETVYSVWEERMKACSDLPAMVFIPTGYDDRPRCFSESVITVGRTPDLFREACQKAKDFCRKYNIKRVVLDPVNEWQEGSILEPNEDYGFGYYNAFRDVFCQKPKEGWPADLTPKECGLGPYDYPPMEIPARTKWTFDKGNEGWYRMPYGAPQIRVKDGKLKLFRMNPKHVAMRIRVQPFKAAEFTKMVVRMKITLPESDGKEIAAIQWSRTDFPIFDKDLAINHKSEVKVPVQCDGQWRDVVFDLAGSPEWKGSINEFWFDPVNRAHAEVEIDQITLE
ncbi:MAG: glycoside hydrolase family 99-like domain-containing protein, partial [Planctomycetia bacterium]|nr:glycoside hydrolase family 99-like domain-containing protein [Planctomycetia bacterium]